MHQRGRQAVSQADAAAFVFDAVRVELVVAVRETILFLTQRFPMLSREETYMIAIVAVDRAGTLLAVSLSMATTSPITRRF